MQLPQLYLIKGYLLGQNAPDEVMGAVNALLKYPNQDDVVEENVPSLEDELAQKQAAAAQQASANGLKIKVELVEENEPAQPIIEKPMIQKMIDMENLIDAFDEQEPDDNDIDVVDIEQDTENTEITTEQEPMLEKVIKADLPALKERKTKIPSCDLERIKKRVAQGESFTEIGKTYDVTGQSIANYLTKHGAHEVKKRAAQVPSIGEMIDEIDKSAKSGSDGFSEYLKNRDKAGADAINGCDAIDREQEEEKPFVDVPIEKLQTVHDEYAGKRDPAQELQDSDWPDIQSMLRKGVTHRKIAGDYDVPPRYMSDWIDKKLIEDAREKDQRRKLKVENTHEKTGYDY